MQRNWVSNPHFQRYCVSVGCCIGTCQEYICNSIYENFNCLCCFIVSLFYCDAGWEWIHSLSTFKIWKSNELCWFLSSWKNPQVKRRCLHCPNCMYSNSHSSFALLIRQIWPPAPLICWQKDTRRKKVCVIMHEVHYHHWENLERASTVMTHFSIEKLSKG